MNKRIFIYLTFIGLIGLLFSCEKEGTKAVLSASPIAPTLTTVPNLTLKRTSGTDILVFVGTPVEAGFQASVTYYLEACAKGNNFKDSVLILSDIQDLSMKIAVSDLNGILLKKFTADQVTAVDLRIRAALSLSSGTGSYIYSSAVKTADVTVYGLPRLDLIGSGITQKVESPLGDGKYASYVKLDKTKPFTLKDSDANIVYGGTGNVLAVNGTAISSSASGWYKLATDTKALTYKMDSYMIGVIGSATANGWNAPDTKMDYNSQEGCWVLTANLQPSLDGGVMKCEFKFRLNDDWGWNIGGTPDKLVQGGGNLTVAPGNYTIKLFISADGTGGTCQLIKN